MADKYLKDEDEEYQFPSSEYIGHKETHPEDEETEGEFEPVPPKRTYKDRLDLARSKAIEYKRLIAICGIIIVILIAFNLMRPHHKTEVISQTKPTATTTGAGQQAFQTTAPATIPTSGVTSMGGQQVQPTRPFNEPSANAGEVARLQENTAANQSRLETMQHQMTDMRDQLKKMQESQRVLNSNIAGLSGQLKELVVQLNNGGRPKKKPQVVLEQIMPIYHLRAIIPGRAWLEDEQGETLTVAIGDRLLGYGRVSQIDSQQGVVSTTSGRLIGFND